jgi:hypothetical protein
MRTCAPWQIWNDPVITDGHESLPLVKGWDAAAMLPGRKFDRQLFEKGRPGATPWYGMAFQLAEVEPTCTYLVWSSERASKSSEADDH